MVRPDEKERNGKFPVWKIHIMKSDGNCYFHAIAAAVSGLYGRYENLTLAEQYNRQLQIRMNLQDHIMSSPDEFYDYIEYADRNGDMSEEEIFKKKMATVMKMTKNGTWGGQLEILAAASFYQTNITVWSNFGPITHRPRNVNTSVAPIHLIFEYEHYNLLELLTFPRSTVLLSRAPAASQYMGSNDDRQLPPIDYDDLCRRTSKLTLSPTECVHDPSQTKSYQDRGWIISNCQQSRMFLPCSIEHLFPNYAGLSKTCVPNKRKKGKKVKSRVQPKSCFSSGILPCCQHIPLQSREMSLGEPAQHHLDEQLDNPLDCLAQAILGDAYLHREIQQSIESYMKCNETEYSQVLLMQMRIRGAEIPHDSYTEQLAVDNLFREILVDVDLRKIVIILLSSLAFKINIVVIRHDGSSELFAGGNQDMDDNIVLIKDENGNYTVLD